jgi:hypothetical protein
MIDGLDRLVAIVTGGSPCKSGKLREHCDNALRAVPLMPCAIPNR